MSERRGLGRGLAALFDEGAPLGSTVARDAVASAAIEMLEPNPGQPRSHFAEEELEALAASIRDKGVIQPIIVRRSGPGGRLQIVAGERRWRAAQRAGERFVPVVVRDLDDSQAMEVALIENVQRADLNPLEEARGYARLTQVFGRSQEAVAQVVGKSRSHVANTLRLLKLPASIQAHLEGGGLTAGHARALIDLPDPGAAAEQVVKGGLNVRQTEALARRLRDGGAGRPRLRQPPKSIDTRDLETHLSDALGLTVEIRERGEGGELRIAYRTLEQLDDLCRRLSRAS